MNQPNFKNLIFIDIETVSSHAEFSQLDDRMQALWRKKHQSITSADLDTPPAESYRDRGAIYAEFGKVITISIGYIYFEGETLKGKIKSLTDHDESNLLIRFQELIQQGWDITKVQFCAHNGKEFDFPYLSRRMIINNLRLPFYLDLMGKKPWEVQHIDTLQMWKFGDYKNYTSLDLLTAVLNIPSPKADIDGSQVTQTYYETKDLNRIGNYCNHDVLATMQVYLRLHNMEIINEENIAFVID